MKQQIYPINHYKIFEIDYYMAEFLRYIIYRKIRIIFLCNAIKKRTSHLRIILYFEFRF